MSTYLLTPMGPILDVYARGYPYGSCLASWYKRWYSGLADVKRDQCIGHKRAKKNWEVQRSDKEQLVPFVGLFSLLKMLAGRREWEALCMAVLVESPMILLWTVTALWHYFRFLMDTMHQGSHQRWPGTLPVFLYSVAGSWLAALQTTPDNVCLMIKNTWCCIEHHRWICTYLFSARALKFRGFRVPVTLSGKVIVSE